MAESACLMRSLSHPSDASRDFREGDPMRALTESISFGRYMVEPLAWEKWSSFSRNRHLEEIEKFAKPGSVAEKKAYFEAHYRKKSLRKETLQLNTEEANAITCTTQTLESHSSIIEPELVTDEKLFSSDEQTEEVNSAVPVADYTDRLNVLTTEISKSEIVDASRTESSEHDLIENNLSQHEEKSTVCDDPKCSNSTTSQEEKEFAKSLSSSNEKKEQKVVSSSKLSTRSRPSRLLLPNEEETKSIPPRKGNYRAVQINEKKPVVNSSDKKKLASKSVHMSMNFGSSNVGPSKAMSPVLKQIKKIKDITASLKLQRESLVSRRTPTQASVNLKPNFSSVDIKSKAKLTSVLEESQTRRTRPLQNITATGGSRASKSSNFHSKENVKPPSANPVKPQALPIACTPFRFRSEERAAKRKEFFQKQEEKRNCEATEENQIHGSCKKTRIRSQQPKFTPKSEDSRAQDNKSQNKTLSNANDESCSIKVKPNIRGRSAKASVTLLPRKSIHENASPNIQCRTLQGK